MKKILSLCLLAFTASLWAEVNPAHVSDMLDQMVRENVISAQEAEKAKYRLKNMSKDQWSAINANANKIASRTPASVSQNKIEEVRGIDLDGAQFKEIQNEVRKIAPQYQD